MNSKGVKEEEEADTRIIVKEWYAIWKEGTWARRGKVPNKA